LISANDQGTVTVFAVRNSSNRPLLEQIRLIDMQVYTPITALTLNSVGSKFAYYSTEFSYALEPNAVEIWEVDTELRLSVLQEGHYNFVSSLAFSPDGKTLASTAEATVRLWNIETGQQEAARKRLGGGRVVTFTPDGKYLAALYETFGGEASAMNLEIWDTDTLETHAGATGNLFRTSFALAISADSSLVASDVKWLNETWPVGVWDMEGNSQGDENATLPREEMSLVTSAAFSPGGKLLAASIANQVRFWQLNTNSELAPFETDGGHIQKIAFSPDGELLAVATSVYRGSAGEHNAIEIWDMASGVPTLILEHPTSPTDVVFSPDGTLIATACRDGEVRLWSLATGEELVALESDGPVVFSPDGLLLALGESNVIRLYHIAPN
jgi:WD40 repeat protein